MSRTFKLTVVSASAVLVMMLLLGAVLGKTADQAPSDPYRHIQVYSEVFSRIKSEYVEEPDMKSVTLGAINGLLVSVDPFSSYLNADQYKQYLKSKETAKAGVGLLLSRKYGYEISIVDAIPGSPADKAGLSTGDVIEAINGISTRDMPLAFADVLLQGDANTAVELTVLRLRKPEPTKINLTRTLIKNPPLITRMADTETGLVKVQSLEPGKVKEISRALAELQKQGAKKMILDLRDCAANDAMEGVALANLFLEKGNIGSLKGERVPKQSFEADPAKVAYKGDLVVLTNRGTTAGAEIAAAALLENKRAQIVGERTYGDAALRKPIATEDGGAVLLAVAKYYTPNGKAIQDTSVTPNVLVADVDPVMEDEELPKSQEPSKPVEDQILKRGLEILKTAGTQTAAAAQGK